MSERAKPRIPREVRQAAWLRNKYGMEPMVKHISPTHSPEHTNGANGKVDAATIEAYRNRGLAVEGNYADVQEVTMSPRVDGPSTTVSVRAEVVTVHDGTSGETVTIFRPSQEAQPSNASSQVRVLAAVVATVKPTAVAR